MATTIKGDAELRRKLAKLKDLHSIVPVLQAAAGVIVNEIKAYPTGNQHRPQPFVSDKQRRGFFAKLRAGEIEVPYRRGQSPGSEDLQQRWKVQSMKGGLQQIIGNNASYGPLVQGPGTQTAYHKQTGWKTTDEVAKDKEEFVLQQIKKQVDRLLAGQ